eukprot:gene19245-biopygen20516
MASCRGSGNNGSGRGPGAGRGQGRFVLNVRSRARCFGLLVGRRGCVRDEPAGGIPATPSPCTDNGKPPWEKRPRPRPVRARFFEFYRASRVRPTTVSPWNKSTGSRVPGELGASNSFRTFPPGTWGTYFKWGVRSEKAPLNNTGIPNRYLFRPVAGLSVPLGPFVRITSRDACTAVSPFAVDPRARQSTPMITAKRHSVVH